jgi:hypothetical protein
MLHNIHKDIGDEDREDLLSQTSNIDRNSTKHFNFKQTSLFHRQNHSNKANNKQSFKYPTF